MRVGVQRPEFVGRRHEVEALAALLESAAAGRFRVAVIEGEAGIGKSRLIAELVPVASKLGFSIVTVACEEYESARAFAPLAAAFGCHESAVEPRKKEIAVLLGEVAEDVDTQHFRLVDRFVELIEAAALRHPLALVVEDSHWSDPATVAVLRTIAKRLRFTPIAVLCTMRPVPRPRALAGFLEALEEIEPVVLNLGPLEERDVADLVESIIGAKPDPALLRFVGGAAGNPLFLGELLAALAQDDSIATGEGGATLRGESLPPDLRPTILRRISYLSDGALEVLRAASILGATFAPHDVAALKGEPMSALVAAFDECVDANVIEERGSSMRFRHDLIRDALYLDRPEPVRAALHVEAARTLERAGAPLQQVAEQYVLGARRGDASAIETIRKVAMTVERSPATRIDLLERALALTEPGDPVRDAIRADLAEVMVSGGRPEEADAIARELVSTPALSGRMRAVTVQALRLGARWVELVERVEPWIDDAIEGEERVELMAAVAHARGSSIAYDAREAAAMARDALRLAEEIGDDAAIVAASIAHVASHSRAMLPGLHVLVARAARIAERDPSESILQHQPHDALGRILLTGHMGDVEPDMDAAEEAFRTGMRLAEGAGRVADVPLYLDGLAHLHYYSERWDDAITEAEAAIAAAEEIGTRTQLFGSHAIIAHVSIYRGRLDVAEEHIRAEERLAERLGPQLEDAFLAHRSMLCEVRGDLVGALADRWELFRRETAKGDSLQWWLCLWFGLDLGDAVKVEAVMEWLELRAREKGTEEAAAKLRFATAVVDRDVAGVRAGLEALRTTQSEFDHHQRSAFALARVGLVDEAAAHFRAATEHYDRNDSHAWREQRAAQLQRHGVRVPRRRRSRPATGWDALTEAERRVARSAAEGLTNPQIGDRLFVSPRTVQTHLAHVFQKLGISSRVELAAEVARRSAS